MKRLQYLRGLKKIPKGPYCYQGFSIKIENNQAVMLMHNVCPFRTVNVINDVQIPWCEYLNKGSVSFLNEQEYEKVRNYIIQNLDQYSLCEFGDQVKECGVNL